MKVDGLQQRERNVRWKQSTSERKVKVESALNTRCSAHSFRENESPVVSVCVCVCAWATYVYQVRKWKRAANMESCRHCLPFSHFPSVLRFIIGFEYNGIVMKCAANDGLQTVGLSVCSKSSSAVAFGLGQVLRLRYGSAAVLRRLSLGKNKPNSCSAFVC